MIRGVHTLFYTSEAEALRAFIRDKLGFPYSDVGGGWLIFDLAEADMGCGLRGCKRSSPARNRRAGEDGLQSVHHHQPP